jgi:porin
VDSGFYAACAGLRAKSEALEIVANNVANLNSTGYRAHQATFRSLLMGERASAGPLSRAVNNFGVLAAVENSADFLNSSMGYSPTIMKLPTYPDPGLSGNIVFDNGHRAFGFGLYETKGGGSLFLLEGGQRIAFGNDSRVRVALGAWQLRGNLVTHSDIPQALTNGFYMVDELNLRLQPAGQRDRQLAVFLQYGTADAKISSFGNHFGLGLIWPLPLKSDDSLGIGMSLVTLGRSPGLTLDYDSETAIEFFYKHRFKSIFSVSPDFQIIHHPGGVLGRADAVVFTPRLRAVF